MGPVYGIVSRIYVCMYYVDCRYLFNFTSLSFLKDDPPPPLRWHFLSVFSSFIASQTIGEFLCLNLCVFKIRNGRLRQSDPIGVFN